ncbi:MAG: nucleotidyltransferase family protein [Bacteroidota bacterium]
MNSIAIVVLAAGSAGRMGQPKQLLPWGDSSLLGHAVQTALSTADDTVFVVLGAYSDAIMEQTDLSGTRVLVNANWQEGLGGSIALAVAVLDEKYPEIDAVLFTLADQPLISASHLNAILQLHLQEAHAILITRKEGYRGVPALFPRSYFSELMLLSNDSGAKAVIDANPHEVREVVTADETADIDTDAAYESLFQLYPKI